MSCGETGKTASHMKYTRVVRLIVGAAAVLACVLILWPGVFSKLVTVKEDYMLRKNPSAKLAYEYGSAHFDARAVAMYDIVRAKNLFDRALELDPAYPNVRHQLGRVAFLRGDFRTAMIYLNAEIAMPGGPGTPSSYYMRGLIEGYMGDYEEAIVDYAKYLESDPTNWAALNDYAWVLLKANRPAEALSAVERGLKFFPANPWLLNSKAIALFELGKYGEALVAAELALPGAKAVTDDQWLTAYPGNDPRIAKTGIATLQDSIEENIHRIEQKIAEEGIQ